MSRNAVGRAGALLASKASVRLIYIAIALCVAGIFAGSLVDVLNSPGIDLRCKVVGARRLLAGIDAYPNPATPEPVPSYRMFNDNTYSPPLLLLYAPLSALTYGTQRLLYFVLDWVCLAYMYISIRKWFPGLRTVTYSTLFALFAVADFAFRLHAERGQYYIEIAALTVAVMCAYRESGNRWIGTISLAVLLLIRPTFAIAFIVLWIVGCRREVRNAMLVAVVLASLTVVAFGLQPWLGYLRTVSGLQREYIANVFSPSTRKIPAGDYQKVEGQDFSRSLSTNYAVGRAFIGLSGQATFRPITSRLFKQPSALARFNTGLLMLAMGYCCLLGFMLRNASQEMRVGFAFLSPILIETFGPQRFAYCDVTIVPIVLLILGVCSVSGIDRTAGRMIAGLIVICVCSSVAAPLLPPAGKLITVVSLSRWMCLMFFVNWYFLRVSRNGHFRAVPLVQREIGAAEESYSGAFKQ